MLAALLYVSMLAAPTTGATDSTISLTSAMKWRCIGPFRAGRTVGACGIAEQPFTFYVGVNNGGVWKTTDAGRTWKPIFDDQPTGSIGDVMVAPSNPNIVYVATGEGLHRPDLSTGNGMYRSSDAGKSWKHIGLNDVQQIGGIDIDPKNPDRVFAAAVGHPYGPNADRGVYRTLDGGKTWKKVLYFDENVGAIQVTIDPNNPKIVFADMWEERQGPWENGAWQGPGSGLYKSTDGGDTWRKLTKGLPSFAEGLGRIGFTIARSASKVMYATVDSGALSGLYRSNDAGESWTRVNQERRLISRGSDFAEVKVDPKNAEIVYVGDTSFYRSTDGGVNFTCIKGSPGGDDYHRAWINTINPQIILTAADQGAAVSLNGGETWSSWYNQPTAQFYHVITDNQFPYWVYGGQQESGSAGVQSRSDTGQITFRNWRTVGADEYAYVAPHPTNFNLIYGGKGTKFYKDTGQVEFIGPNRQAMGLRFLRTSPILFSPHDPNQLLIASQFLLRTTDDGKTWNKISPDLSREQPEVPDSVGKYRTEAMKTMPRRGVIYTVSISPKDKNMIWCGTDDGLIWRTTDDGKTWDNVTPPTLTSWSKVSIIEAGHHDPNVAYAAINRIRVSDQKPHILRTQDGGKTWMEIVNLLPNAPINSVKEDPKQPGLLFCGSETEVHYSIDDGANWLSLRNNMPATSIRDLVIHGDDIVVGTHGRSFWILDNMSALRSVAKGFAVGSHQIFPIANAYLLERDWNTDTPIPPDEAMGENPPDGAIIDYWIAGGANSARLEVFDGQGALIRKYSSTDRSPSIDPKSITVMPGWALPPQILSTGPGMRRFVWDLRRPRPDNAGTSLPISAVWGKTPVYPLGALVAPGVYTVKLTVDGKTSQQPITVLDDPRKLSRTP